MAYTKTSIISLAVMLLGHKPIQTLDNADDMVISAEQAFDILLPSVLATGNWRFSMKIQQLVLSTEIPPTQTNWTQIYLLPAGYLKNIRIIPQNYVYEIYSNNQIWCNWGTQSPIFMEYAYLPEIAQLPAVFVNYFIYEIATFLCLSTAQNLIILQHWKTRKMYNGLLPPQPMPRTGHSLWNTTYPCSPNGILRASSGRK